MNLESKHLLMDIWYDQDVEPIVDRICKIVDTNFTVVSKAGHQFHPQGRTIVYILSESHFTVHTYPEHQYITLDIYICNPSFNLEKIKDQILGLSETICYNSLIKDRGIPLTTED